MTWLDRIALATLRLAEKGNSQALKEVWERLEGKVKQDLDVTIESQLWARLNAGRQRLQVEQHVLDVVAQQVLAPDFGDDDDALVQDEPLTALDSGHGPTASDDEAVSTTATTT